jgi:hypothetical protein
VAWTSPIIKEQESRHYPFWRWKFVYWFKKKKCESTSADSKSESEASGFEIFKQSCANRHGGERGHRDLLFDIWRSARTPDKLPPFGHGKALYFYSLLVALFTFGSGGVLAAHEGINRILHPELLEHPEWNYTVLAVGFLFEGYSWRISRRELMKHASAGNQPGSEYCEAKTLRSLQFSWRTQRLWLVSPLHFWEFSSDIFCVIPTLILALPSW